MVNYLPNLCQDSPNSCWENQYFAKCEWVSEFVSEWVNFANLELHAQLKIKQFYGLKFKTSGSIKVLLSYLFCRLAWSSLICICLKIFAIALRGHSLRGHCFCGDLFVVPLLLWWPIPRSSKQTMNFWWNAITFWYK